MNNKKETSKAVIAIVLICVIGAGLLFGVNAFAAPMIEANNASLAYAPLLAVMPEAKDFAPVYEQANAGASALVDVPETVVGIYEETSGAGYAVKLSTTQGYTGNTIEFAIGVSADGKITGTQLTAFNDTKDFGADYPATYVGQDSALADVQLVAGVTFSSSAFKNAVIDAFSALIANGLVKEGVKGDDQLLMELMPTLFSGIANAGGIAQYEELTPSGSIISAMKALNGSGVALLMQDGESVVLAVANLAGSVTVYNAAGEDVTADHAAAADEAAAFAKGNLSDVSENEMKKLASAAEDGAVIEPVALEGVYSSVTGAYKITLADESVQYGFVARPYGFSEPMLFYYVLDENGAIVSMNTDAFIQEKEYYSNYTLDVPSYKDSFTGCTADTFSEDQTLISGATITANAVKTATADIFAAFEAISNGGNN